MNLSNLTKIKSKYAKRVGRGAGTGKGKTSGRGTKGQNARKKLPITHSHFEGGQRPLFKRLPYRRGKGNKSLAKKPIVINLSSLSKLPKNSVVTLKLLVEHKIVDKSDAKIYGVKILGMGNIDNALTFEVPTSKSVAKKFGLAVKEEEKEVKKPDPIEKKKTVKESK